MKNEFSKSTVAVAKGTNPMRKVKLEKVTVNMGVGEAGDKLERSLKVMEQITGRKPVKTICRIKQPGWGIKEGLEIGAKTVLRGAAAEKFLASAFTAKENKISSKNFDRNGNFGFGVKEHIEMPGIKYDPKLGIIGFDVLVTLERPGYRIKKRKIMKGTIGRKHCLTKDDAISFVREKFGVEVE